ncbi:hypothetical protein ACB092_07G114300 [Castanea dentata]
MMSTPEDSKESDELKCTCGLPAKLRASETPKNPFRLFIIVPRVFMIMGEIEEEHEDEKTIWNEEKSALMSQLSTVQAELDEIKKRIKMANESVLMPLVDKFSKSDDEADDAIIIHTKYRIDVESF